MNKQEIYNFIEDKTKMHHNRVSFGQDEPSYEFEPGNTAIPRKIDIIYNSSTDKGLITLDLQDTGFIDELRSELGNIDPKVYGGPQTNQRLLEFDGFKAVYTVFGEALDKVINKYRIFVPSLVKTKFEHEDRNEYSLRTKNGQLWIPGYICNGAFYDIMLASWDLTGFESYKEIRDYAEAMMRVHSGLTKNYFTINIENQGIHIDYQIKAEAVSKEKIKFDLEKIIEICDKY